ncbi:hypothetical protein IX51_10425 [uncultured archaeon]|nr:hypothetical protein IX51_10425 [uncultured archaeon]HKJ96721.1 hypothetical protein [Thermoplasmataceae archaeon]
MHISTFINLVESEYDNIVREAKSLKENNEQFMFERPTFLCDLVQKYRTWLIMSMRAVDIHNDEGKVSPEDVLIHSAILKAEGGSGTLLHPKVAMILSLFDREDFVSIFSESDKDSVEEAADTRIALCRFSECFPFCSNFSEL